MFELLSLPMGYGWSMTEFFALFSLELHLHISEITAGLKAENEELRRQLREMQVSILYVDTSRWQFMEYPKPRVHPKREKSLDDWPCSAWAVSMNVIDL